MRMPSRTGKVRFRTLTECEFKLTPCFSPAIIPRCFCGEHADNTHRVVSWVVERGIGGLQLTEHCTAIRYCIVEDTRVGWSTVLRHVEDIVGAVGVDDSLMSCRGQNGFGPHPSTEDNKKRQSPAQPSLLRVFLKGGAHPRSPP